MSLTNEQRMKASIMAVILIKEKDRDELRTILEEIGEGEQSLRFAETLRVQLIEGTESDFEGLTPDLAREVVERMRANIEHRLSIPVER